MDLLELNDIYCKDAARLKNEKLFVKDIHVEYSFIPTEDQMFSSSKTPLRTVVNHPFKGAGTKEFNHDLSEFEAYVNGIQCTSWYDDPRDTRSINGMSLRENMYNVLAPVVLQGHPDVMFSDKIQGLTLAMTAVRNENTFFENAKGSVPVPSPLYVTENGYPVDSRSLSLIYIRKNGVKDYGFGPIIYMGAGMTSISDPLRMYILSSVHIINRHSGFEADTWEHMTTSCVILYEDSIKRILDMNKGNQ